MDRLADLPVSVELPGVLGQEVSRYVEVEAGWQVVSPGGPPTPVLALAGAPQPGRACVVVVDGAPTAEQVREGLFAGALDVLAWPADRARLLEAPQRIAHPESPARGPGFLRVAGVAGGVGTSTVALALGALLAWSGRRTVVVGDQDLLALCGMAGWSGPGAAELSALGPAAAGEFDAVARPVRGVPGLLVLAGDGAAPTDTTAWPVDAVLADTRAQGPELTRLADSPEALATRHPTPAEALAASAEVLPAEHVPYRAPTPVEAFAAEHGPERPATSAEAFASGPPPNQAAAGAEAGALAGRRPGRALTPAEVFAELGPDRPAAPPEVLAERRRDRAPTPAEVFAEQRPHRPGAPAEVFAAGPRLTRGAGLIPAKFLGAERRAATPAGVLAAGRWQDRSVAPTPAELGAAGALVVVARPDAAVRWAAPVAARSVVVLAGSGPLDLPSVRRWLGRHPDAVLPYSGRVARAGLRGRVPSALPGTWLAPLRATFVLRRRAS